MQNTKKLLTEPAKEIIERCEASDIFASCKSLSEFTTAFKGTTAIAYQPENIESAYIKMQQAETISVTRYLDYVNNFTTLTGFAEYYELTETQANAYIMLGRKVNEYLSTLSVATNTKPEIKTLDITAKEWFDKVNGNSYFAARIIINFGLPDERTITLPFQYGYGNHYEYQCFKALQECGYIIIQLQDSNAPWRYYWDHNIIACTNKIDKCLKRDVIAWGK